MKKTIISLLFLMTVALVFGQGKNRPVIEFPKPHYEHHNDDPEWLQTAAKFHGHLGPAVVIGARLGAAGLAAVNAKGYFDVEILCEGPFTAPPQSCMVDGVQISTGATLGKRNLTIVESKNYSVLVKNRKSGTTAVLIPKPELLRLAWSQLHNDNDHDNDHNNDNDHDKSDPIESMKKVEAIARRIALMPDDEIMTITFPEK